MRIRADVGGQPGRGAAEVENGRREWVEEQEKMAPAGCSVRNTNRNTVRGVHFILKLHARHPFDTGLVP